MAMGAVLRATQAVGTGMLPPPFAVPRPPALCLPSANDSKALPIPSASLMCSPQLFRLLHLPTAEESCAQSLLLCLQSSQWCYKSLMLHGKDFGWPWLPLGVKLPSADMRPTCSLQSRSQTLLPSAPSASCAMLQAQSSNWDCAALPVGGDGCRPVLEQGTCHLCCILHLPNPSASSRFAYTGVLLWLRQEGSSPSWWATERRG